ncbi:hypothetical protein TNCV_2666091 [Trichonephila clavipes]|nr:hypothetical protein TNCV_2666091 [Trichonephila clavipes]
MDITPRKRSKIIVMKYQSSITLHEGFWRLLKLDGTRATARQRLFPEGWEEMKNRMKENVSNQENSPAERGGGRTRNTKRSIDAERRRGRGRTQEGSRDG